MSDHDQAVESAVTLHITPSIRRDAELYSKKQGLTLDTFVTTAIAEKLAHLQQAEWASKREPVTAEDRNWALGLLDRMGTEPPQPGDELPNGYIRRKA